MSHVVEDFKISHCNNANNISIAFSKRSLSEVLKYEGSQANFEIDVMNSSSEQSKIPLLQQILALYSDGSGTKHVMIDRVGEEMALLVVPTRIYNSSFNPAQHKPQLIELLASL